MPLDGPQNEVPRSLQHNLLTFKCRFQRKTSLTTPLLLSFVPSSVYLSRLPNPKAPAGPHQGPGSQGPWRAGPSPQSPLLRPGRDARRPGLGRGPQLGRQREGGVCPRRGPAGARGHERLVGRVLRPPSAGERNPRDPRAPVIGLRRPPPPLAPEAPADPVRLPRIVCGWEESWARTWEEAAGGPGLPARPPVRPSAPGSADRRDYTSFREPVPARNCAPWRDAVGGALTGGRLVSSGF